jgi:hypothetical protein
VLPAIYPHNIVANVCAKLAHQSLNVATYDLALLDGTVFGYFE